MSSFSKNTKLRNSSVVSLLCSVLSLSPIPAQATDWLLFSFGSEKEQLEQSSKHLLNVHYGANQADINDRLVFNLNGTQFSLQVSRIERHPNGDVSMVGFVNSSNKVSILTIGKKGVIGTLNLADQTLSLKVNRNGQWLHFPDMDGVKREAVKVDMGGLPVPHSYANDEGKVQPSARMTVGGKPVIDVAVLWDLALEDDLGSVDAVMSLIQQRIAETNQAFIDSEVDAEVRFVYGERRDYDNSISNANALQDLQAGNGVFDGISSFRNTHGADLVGFMRKFNLNLGSAGIAYRLGSNGQIQSNDKNYAFFVSSEGEFQQGSTIYYSPDNTFPHELGHNLGAEHDHSHASGTAPIFSYAYGHDVPGEFATIMSYDNPGVMRYSNPDILCTATEPCGIEEGNPQAADNARTFSQTTDDVAFFYPAVYAYGSAPYTNSEDEEEGISTSIEFSIDDDNTGGSQGDGDGQYENGETLEINVTLTNDGSAQITGVQGTLASSESCVTLLDSQTSWPNISASASLQADNDFEVTLSNCPTSREIDFSLQVVTDQGNESHTFSLQVTEDTDDFTVSNLNVTPDSAEPGDGITASVRHIYQGTNSADQTVSLGFYLSNNPTYSLNDILLGTETSVLSSTDTSEVETINFTLPNSLNDGLYYLIARADNADAYEESNESNNTAAKSIDIIVDSDSDGVRNSEDEFPDNPGESIDSDGDGVGDNSDAFPNDASETADSDGDGVGNNSDAFPNDASETADRDGDGVGDNSDVFPNDPNESSDIDGDGMGDNADTDNAPDYQVMTEDGSDIPESGEPQRVSTNSGDFELQTNDGGVLEVSFENLASQEVYSLQINEPDTTSIRLLNNGAVEVAMVVNGLQQIFQVLNSGELVIVAGSFDPLLPVQGSIQNPVYQFGSNTVVVRASLTDRLQF